MVGQPNLQGVVDLGALAAARQQQAQSAQVKAKAPAGVIIDVTDAAGKVIAPELLKKSERVHRQLRPALPADYAGKMARVFAGGARMSVALDGDDVAGVARDVDL